MRRLLAFRLDSDSQEAARSQWLAVVEGQHALWAGVSQPYKHTIRAFLVHFHTAILRHSTERFNFQNGSVGARRHDPALHLFHPRTRTPIRHDSHEAVATAWLSNTLKPQLP